MSTETTFVISAVALIEQFGWLITKGLGAVAIVACVKV